MKLLSNEKNSLRLLLIIYWKCDWRLSRDAFAPLEDTSSHSGNTYSVQHPPEHHNGVSILNAYWNSFPKKHITSTRPLLFKCLWYWSKLSTSAQAANYKAINSFFFSHQEGWDKIFHHNMFDLSLHRKHHGTAYRYSANKTMSTVRINKLKARNKLQTTFKGAKIWEPRNSTFINFLPMGQSQIGDLDLNREGFSVRISFEDYGRMWVISIHVRCVVFHIGTTSGNSMFTRYTNTMQMDKCQDNVSVFLAE